MCIFMAMLKNSYKKEDITRYGMIKLTRWTADSSEPSPKHFATTMIPSSTTS